MEYPKGSLRIPDVDGRAAIAGNRRTAREGDYGTALCPVLRALVGWDCISEETSERQSEFHILRDAKYHERIDLGLQVTKNPPGGRVINNNKVIIPSSDHF